MCVSEEGKEVGQLHYPQYKVVYLPGVGLHECCGDHTACNDTPLPQAGQWEVGIWGSVCVCVCVCVSECVYEVQAHKPCWYISHQSVL